MTLRAMRAAPVFFALPYPLTLEGYRAYKRGRSSGSRIILHPAPSQGFFKPQWPFAGFVPGHGGGTAGDSHPTSLLSPFGHPLDLNYSKVRPSVNTSERGCSKNISPCQIAYAV